ncbi:elongation of very long chain fatty acids protein 7-like isoform X2 [Vespula squamosa]|uniref:Elongation of very long chain fatty acids protein n=1 Tax=Vespula squamosa TaxID=30214 RepID=A0ABD2AWR4_VESSQ
MIIIAWIGTRYLPGGHGTFLGLINSFVHVIMYTHYLWTSLNLGKAWWKKYITQLQIFQFVMIFLQFLLGAFTKDCAYPNYLLLLFLPHNAFIMILFIDFYYKSYIQKKPSQIDKSDLLTRTDQSGAELSNGKPKISEDLTKSKSL